MSCWAKQRVVRCEVETSPGKVPYECLSCNYVIARRRLKNNQVKEVVFLIVHARVPIPRKGTVHLSLLMATSLLQPFYKWRPSYSLTFGNTPTAPLPRPPTPHGQERVVLIMGSTLLIFDWYDYGYWLKGYPFVNYSAFYRVLLKNKHICDSVRHNKNFVVLSFIVAKIVYVNFRISVSVFFFFFETLSTYFISATPALWLWRKVPQLPLCRRRCRYGQANGRRCL